MADLIRTVLDQEVVAGTIIVHDASATCDLFGHVRVDVSILDMILPGTLGSAIVDAPAPTRHVPCADLCVDAILSKRRVERVPIGSLDIDKSGNSSH